jgi:hypothetical protein
MTGSESKLSATGIPFVIEVEMGIKSYHGWSISFLNESMEPENEMRILGRQLLGLRTTSCYSL